MPVVDVAIALAAGFIAVVAALVLLLGLKIGMKRSVLVFLCVAVAAIVANYAPLINTHSEQDECAFGPVTNDQYRQYLSQARAHIRTRSASDLDSELSRVFREISGNETLIYPRIAIMHATLRAFGAEYRNTNGTDPDDWGRSDPYLKATNRSPLVAYHYLLDVNRLRYFLPWPREAWVMGNLAGPRYAKAPGPLYPKRRGGLAFIVNWPSLIDPNPVVKSTGSCPPVPNKDLAEGFSFAPN